MLLRCVIARVLDDTLAHPQRQVQSAMCRIPVFEVLHDAQSVQIVIKPQSVRLKAAVQCTLAGMAEGRMPDIVH